jgi:hypothetical protein
MNQNEEYHYNRILAQMDALDARVAEYHADENIREMFRA